MASTAKVGCVAFAGALLIFAAPLAVFLLGHQDDQTPNGPPPDSALVGWLGAGQSHPPAGTSQSPDLPAVGQPRPSQAHVPLGPRGDGQQPKQPAAENPPPSKQPATEGEDAHASPVRQVVGAGVGTNAEEAKKNALQNAVEQAVGGLVDAETLLENEKLISEKVLTYSNGYVEKFRVISTQERKGAVHVKVVADVKVRALSDRLQNLSVATRKAVDGPSLAREAKAKVRRDADARAMLLEVTKGFPVNCLEAAVGKEKVTKAKNERGNVELEVPVRISVNMAKYKKFDDAFRKVIVAMARRSKKYSFEPRPIQVLDATNEVANGTPLYNLVKLQIGSHFDFQKVHYGVIFMPIGAVIEKARDMDTFGVMLFEKAEKDWRRMEMTIFELDKSLLSHFESARQGDFRITVRLLGKNGEVLTTKDRNSLFLGKGYPYQGARSAQKGHEKQPGRLVGITKNGKLEATAVASANLVAPEVFVGGRKLTDKADHLMFYPVVPFFYYDLCENAPDGQAFSPEIRFVMPFEIEVDELDRVKFAECVLSLEEGESTFSGKEN